MSCFYWRSPFNDNVKKTLHVELYNLNQKPVTICQESILWCSKGYIRQADTSGSPCTERDICKRNDDTRLYGACEEYRTCGSASVQTCNFKSSIYTQQCVAGCFLRVVGGYGWEYRRSWNWHPQDSQTSSKSHNYCDCTCMSVAVDRRSIRKGWFQRVQLETADNFIVCKFWVIKQQGHQRSFVRSESRSHNQLLVSFLRRSISVDTRRIFSCMTNLYTRECDGHCP